MKNARTVTVNLEVDTTQVQLALAELEHLADRAELIALASRIIDEHRAERDRARTIAVALEAELAETTDRLTESEYLVASLREEWGRAQRGWEREGRRVEDMARRNAELRTEADALRAQVAELTRLNAEGRPWQITRAETGA